MAREYSKIEIDALHQLAHFKDIFYPDLSSHGNKPEKIKAHFNRLKEAADTFTEIFCQNNFADSDYSIMQNEPREFETPDLWINQINIDTVLKCLTYIIWNNKIDDGYFLKKIEDNLIKKHLTRLHDILAERKKQLKLQGTNLKVLSTNNN